MASDALHDAAKEAAHVRRRLLRRVDAFDRSVDDMFNHIRGNPVADRLFYGASALGDHSLIWLLLAVARGLRSREPHVGATARAAAAIGAESLLVNWGIKSLFRRKRPLFEGIRPQHLRRPLTSSFPSGHATSAFTAAAMLGQDDPLRPLYYGAAVVVAASRIHVKIHHASDIVGGVVVGVVLGQIARRVVPMPAIRGESDRAARS
jgi:membrane-associated phospholipid phosphatase